MKARAMLCGACFLTSLIFNQINGVGNRETDQAVIKLRNWLDDNTGGQGGKGTVTRRIYAKTEEALRAFIAKEPVNQLRQAKEELFPIPGGDVVE